jgi:4-hydroxy-tetrahydrodipicolinate synthase
MPASPSLRGVWTAALTPFDARLGIDTAALVQHCRGLLAAGCRGISLFGTTGEGTALSPDERMAALDAVVAAGISGDRLMPSVGCTDVPTTVALGAHAARHGAAGLLVLPPFYLKGVSEEGVYRHFAAVIDGLAAGGGKVPRLCLYNFPLHTGITLSPALVRRLADAFPGIVAAVKDSSADWPLSASYLDVLPDLDIFVGDEKSLAAALGKGGAGGISGMANVIAPTLVALCNGPEDERTRLQAAVATAVDAVVAHSFISTVKAVLAVRHQRPGWLRVRPALDEAPLDRGRAVIDRFKTAGVAAG